MNVWTMISMAMCASLTVQLMFYTDEHRRKSRWYWRVVLFLVTIYSGTQVITFLYEPLRYTQPVLALFHVGLLIGAHVMRPEYLPGNSPNDPPSKTHRLTRNATHRFR